MKKGGNIAFVLFVVIMMILFLPIAQQVIRFHKTKPLHGAIIKYKQPQLDTYNWLSGNYQDKMEKYLNQNFGFRNILVRLNNQLYFWLFKEAKANDVIIGKDNYLYEKSYIDAYYGNDFLGKDTINAETRKLKAIQDTLHKQGKLIILVFAPGKASFLPEYIPDRLKTKKKLTNHDYYVKRANKLGLNYIDFRNWFLKMKDTSRYRLYPKTGIHWSYYGAALSTDSLVRYIAYKQHITLPNIVWKNIKISRKLRNVDRDIELGMNLLFPLSNVPMPYPKLEIQHSNKASQRLLVIADSYYWQIYSSGIPQKVFRKQQFWFYNKQVRPLRNGRLLYTDELDFKQEMENQDIIVLLCTEPVLKRFFWGFIDDLYNMFYHPAIFNKTHAKKIVDKKIINRIIYGIRNNAKWFEIEKEKAYNKNISIDSMLKIDAVYIINKRNEK